MTKKQHNNAGFGLVETLVALAIFITIATTGITTVLQSLSANRLGEEETQALFFAQEGIEAVRSIRKQGWTSPFLATNCTSGCGLTATDNKWSFSGSASTHGKFTRTVYIQPVLRSGQTIVTSGGTMDHRIKRITSRVTWSFGGLRTNEVELVSYLSRHDYPAPSCDWSNGSVQAAYNFSSSNPAVKIKYQNGFLFVILSDPGGAPYDFAILNVTTPTNPQPVAAINLPGNPTNIAVSGKYAYISSDNNAEELQIVDFTSATSPANPIKVGAYNAAGTSDAYGVFVENSTVFLGKEGSSSHEFFVIDASNPANPILAGPNASVDLGGNNRGIREIWILGDYAYVGSNDNNLELKVINITSLTSPTHTGLGYDVPGNTIGNTIRGFDTSILLGTGDGKIYIFDVSNPQSIPDPNTYTASQSVNDVAVDSSATYAFLATSLSSSSEIESFYTDGPFSSLFGIDTGVTLTGIAVDTNQCALYAAGQPNASGAEIAVVVPGAGSSPTVTPTPIQGTPTPAGPTSTPTSTLTPTLTPTRTPTPSPSTTINSCSSFCLQNTYSNGSCRRNNNHCTQNGGTPNLGGSSYCPAPGDPSNYTTCCCFN